MNYKPIFSLLLTIFFFSCEAPEASDDMKVKEGMFKRVILYPKGEGKTFDMNYYENRHMPMVAGYLGENLLFYEIDKGISGSAPGDVAPFVAIGYFYIKDINIFNDSIANNRDKILGDIKNYTNIQPMLQLSEIKAVR